MWWHSVSVQVTNLRKKYDDLVTFTVSLTGERDMLLNALDALKRDLRKELAARHDLERGAKDQYLRRDSISLHKRRR